MVHLVPIYHSFLWEEPSGTSSWTPGGPRTPLLRTTGLWGGYLWRAAISMLKLLPAVHHAALRFITGDSYGTHHCLVVPKTLASLVSGLPVRRDQRRLFIYLFMKLLYKTSSLLERW